MNIRQEKHLMRHSEKDSIYREMLYIRSIYEQGFNRILALLSPEDQYLLKMYVKACEAVDARIIRTAYFMKPTR